MKVKQMRNATWANFKQMARGRRLASSAFAGSLALIAIGCSVRALAGSGEQFVQTPSTTAGDCNVGRDNNGSLNCHNNNFYGAHLPPRNLDDANMADLKKQMLTQISKTDPIAVTAIMGDNESDNFAMQIYEYLKSNGFATSNGSAKINRAMFAHTPVGLVLEKSKDGKINLIVGKQE